MSACRKVLNTDTNLVVLHDGQMCVGGGFFRVDRESGRGREEVGGGDGCDTGQGRRWGCA